MVCDPAVNPAIWIWTAPEISVAVCAAPPSRLYVIVPVGTKTPKPAGSDGTLTSANVRADELRVREGVNVAVLVAGQARAVQSDPNTPAMIFQQRADMRIRQRFQNRREAHAIEPLGTCQRGQPKVSVATDHQVGQGVVRQTIFHGPAIDGISLGHGGASLCEDGHDRLQ